MSLHEHRLESDYFSLCASAFSEEMDEVLASSVGEAQKNQSDQELGDESVAKNPHAIGAKPVHLILGDNIMQLRETAPCLGAG